MKIQIANHQQAFTVFEALVVVTVALLLAAMFLPLMAGRNVHHSHSYCVENLKQVGIAFRIWEGDNNDKFPMDVAVTNGGAREWVAAGNVVGYFQVMSNELATPKILVCGEDTKHEYATNFATMTSANLSYFVGVNVVEPSGESLFSGDANLTHDGRMVSAKFLNLSTNAVGWTPGRHHGFGNVLVADGSVQTVKQVGFVSSPGTYLATNGIVVP